MSVWIQITITVAAIAGLLLWAAYVVQQPRQRKHHLLLWTIIGILVLTIIFMALGCCDPGVEPGWPYGQPDNMQRLDEGNGAIEIEYTYHCLQGEHVRITYFRPDKCSNFQKIGEDRTEGLCAPFEWLGE